MRKENKFEVLHHSPFETAHFMRLLRANGRYFYHVITFIFLSLFCINTYASSGDDLSVLLDSVHTMRANFTQKIYDNRGQVIQKSYGSMALSRPGKFRWEVKKPIPQLVIANSEKLWIYDPDLEQVTIRSLVQQTGQTPAVLLSNQNSTIDSDYKVTMQNNKNGLQWFTLHPKSEESMFESMELGFAQQQIHEMRLEDRLGHKTVIQFSNINTTANLPASLFTFKPPKNVDVINETQRQQKRH